MIRLLNLIINKKKTMDTYLKYIELVRTNKLILDATNQLILEVFLLNRNERITVSDLLAMRDIASQATIHKKLTQLINTNYLEINADDKDGRVKYISLGKEGIKHFAELSKLILLATKK